MVLENKKPMPTVLSPAPSLTSSNSSLKVQLQNTDQEEGSQLLGSFTAYHSRYKLHFLEVLPPLVHEPVSTSSLADLCR